MNRNFLAGALRLLCACALLLLVGAPPVLGASISLSRSNSTETLTFSFDTVPPDTRLMRTGEETVFLALPADFLAKNDFPPRQAFDGPGLVSAVTRTPRGLEISLSDSAFGFITMPGSGVRLVAQFFKDPIGARWQPSEAPPRPAATARPAPEPAPQAAKAAPKPPTPATSAPAQQTPEPQPKAPEPKPEEPVAQEKPASPPPAAEETPAEPRGEGPTVSYALRAPMSSLGPEDSKAYSTLDTLPEAPDLSALIEPDAAGPGAAEPEATESESAKAEPSAVEPVAPVETAESGPAPAAPEPEAAPVPETPQGVATTAPAQEIATSRPEDFDTGPHAVRMKASKKTLNELLGQAGEVAAKVEPQAEEVVQQAEEEIRQMAEAAPAPEPGPGDKIETGEPHLQAGKVTQVSTLDEVDDTEPTEHLRQLETNFQMAVGMVANGNYASAVTNLNSLLADPELTDAMREEALYLLAESLFQSNLDDLPGHYREIVAAFEQAMNFNTKSGRLPSALLNLGLLNLKVENIPEATAYFNLLKKRYPDDQTVPYIHYYWGRHYYDNGLYQQAADEFQQLVQAYPDSDVVRDAALGLAKSLDHLGYYDQAYQIVDYIDKRWPRFYVESPEFLALSGNIAGRLDKFGAAKEDYWTYYNLEPDAEGMDVILARIGDIYLRENKRDTAREVYDYVAKNYSDEQGGLVAKMRLAEEGVYDDPSIAQMFTVFDRPYNRRPVEIYSEIVKKYPKSALAPLAQLKLAMWYLWEKNYADSLDAASAFFAAYPDSSLADRARKAGIDAFVSAVDAWVAEENYSHVVALWEGHPFLRANLDDIPAATRLSLALSLFHEKEPTKALALAAPYLKDPKDDAISQAAVSLALNIYLDQNAWNEIIQLAELPGEQALPVKQRREVDYAHALALVNLGRLEESRPLWAKLSTDYNLDPLQRAYALYYMAKFAGEEKNLENQYRYAQEALSIFLHDDGDTSKIKDTLAMLTEVTSQAGRYQDALRYARMYDSYVKEDDPDWGASRFRLAEIHRSLDDYDSWERILKDIIAKKPDSLYARMAKSALEARQLEMRANQYS